jgi:NAD(P)-dependent dehydrogenase (short-subunit alcohol dehydrogenase family)
MLIDLTGKTALVTGSTTGIGYATAAAAAAGGADAVVAGEHVPAEMAVQIGVVGVAAVVGRHHVVAARRGGERGGRLV